MRFDSIKSKPASRHYLLPPSVPRLPCDLIFEDSWLAEPATHSHALFFDRSDFAAPEAWAALLTVYPLHRLDLAHYSRQHPDLPPGPMLLALGLRKNYQSLAEWEEAGQISATSRALGREHDLPLATLRLYNRWEESEQQNWDNLWKRRKVKKNLIREIIHDFHDLDGQKRTSCFAAILAFEESWVARSAPFPSETLRDMVRAHRFPELMAQSRLIREKLRELRLPPEIQIPLPADLEASQLEIRIAFTSEREFHDLMKHLGPDQTQELEKILELL